MVWGAATSKATTNEHSKFVHAFVVADHPLFGSVGSNQPDISAIALRPERTQTEGPRIELRGYQKLAIKRAVSGNIILSLPTGKGKTIVAVNVLDHFFKANPTLKVLFVVPTRVLVPQQATYILAHAQTEPRIVELCGQMVAEWTSAAWEKLLRAHDVLVGTPEIFRRAFVDSGVLKVSAVSLIIYDVSTHTNASPRTITPVRMQPQGLDTLILL